MKKVQVIKSKNPFKFTFFFNSPVFVLLFLFLFTHCISSSDKAAIGEKQKIERSEMINIVADLVLVESILVEENHGTKDIKILSYEYFHEVLKTHSVSKIDFEKTLDMYMNDHDNIDKFLTDIITELTRRNENLKKG